MQRNKQRTGRLKTTESPARAFAQKTGPDYKMHLNLAVDAFAMDPKGPDAELLLKKIKAIASQMDESDAQTIRSAAQRLRMNNEDIAAETIAFLEEKIGVKKPEEAPEPHKEEQQERPEPKEEVQEKPKPTEEVQEKPKPTEEVQEKPEPKEEVHEKPKPKLTKGQQETLNSHFLDAAATGRLEHAIELLEQGADIDARDSAGRTGLMWAARGNHTDMVRYLGSRTDVNAIGEGGFTALMYASITNHYDAVEALLDLKADPLMVNENKDTAASLASREGHMKVFNILKRYEAGDEEKKDVADLDAYRQIDRYKEFLSAVKNNDVHLAENLLNDGADIDARYENRMTALMYALERRHTEASLFLIENNSDPNAKDYFDITVLMYALDNQMPGIADALIQKGANVKAADHHWRTCLMRATYRGYSGLIDRMIDDGAEVDARDISQSTALMDAANNNQLEAAERLLERGADPNAENDRGMTPLMWAREGNHRQMIELLNRYGAIEKEEKRKTRKRIWKFLFPFVVMVGLGAGAILHVDGKELRKAERVVSALSQKRYRTINNYRRNSDYIVKAMESSNPSIREKSFWMLSRLINSKQGIPEPEKAVPGILNVFEDIAKEHDDHTLRDACWVVRDLAVRIKDKRVMKPAIPILKEVLKSKKEGCAQQAAATALVAIGKETAVNAFIDVLRNGNKHAQIIAISRLGSIGGERAAKALDLYRQNPPDKLWGEYAEEVYKKITQKNPKQ